MVHVEGGLEYAMGQHHLTPMGCTVRLADSGARPKPDGQQLKERGERTTGNLLTLGTD